MIPAIFGHASKKIILTLGNNYITNYVISYIFNNTTGDGNMDFFNRTGKMAIGSRLRMLTDKITNDAALIFRMYGVDIRPKWFPVFFVLSEGEAKTITSIAREIGHSHPSVSNIVKEMGARGLVKEKKDKTDGRRNLVMLSAKGKKMSDIMAEQYPDVEAAVEQISRQTRNDLWRAIEEWEGLLAEKTLLERVKEAKKEREGRDVSIIPYDPRYRAAFKALNEEWITAHWQMEEPDHHALDHPQEHIGQGRPHLCGALQGRACRRMRPVQEERSRSSVRTGQTCRQPQRAGQRHRHAVVPDRHRQGERTGLQKNLSGKQYPAPPGHPAIQEGGIQGSGDLPPVL